MTLRVHKKKLALTHLLRLLAYNEFIHPSHRTGTPLREYPKPCIIEKLKATTQTYTSSLASITKEIFPRLNNETYIILEYHTTTDYRTCTDGRRHRCTVSHDARPLWTP